MSFISGQTAKANRRLRASSNPYTLMLVILVLWGSFAAISKLVLRSMDSLQMQFYMFGIALLVMTALFVFNGKIGELKRMPVKVYGKLALYALPSFLYYFLYTMSLKLIPAVEASIINYLFPIFIVIFAAPINGERLSVSKILSLLIGFAGTLIMITNGSITSFKVSNIAGDLLALGGAISWGIFSNLGKKNGIDVFLSNYVYTAVCFILSAAGMLLFSSFTLPKPDVLVGVCWISISNIVLSYYLWFRALKLASASLIASLSFITPFVTLFFIMLLVGEKLTYVHIVGLAVIIAGTAIESLGGIHTRKATLSSHRVD